MKKLISLALCVLLAAALAVPVLADVIWEPTNRFYFDHYDECTRAEANYEAQTDADIRNNPQKRASGGTVPAGAVVFVSYAWKGWGYVETRYGDGWVDLSRFRRLYNGADFVADHAGEIVQEDGAVSRAENDAIYFWTYPGSGVIAHTIGSGTFDWADYDPAYYAVWTGEDGLRWGHVGYYYGAEGWICLDEPGADDLPVTGSRYAEDDAGTAPAWDQDPEPTQIASLVISLIVTVIAVTAVILIVLLLRKKKNEA